MSPRTVLAVTMIVVMPLLAGCAPRQLVPLEVVPSAARLYLDGQILEPTPSELELRADRDHKLFFKRDGYRSRLVVLRATRGPGGEERLDPPDVRVRLLPIDRSGRQVEIEAERVPESAD